MFSIFTREALLPLHSSTSSKSVFARYRTFFAKRTNGLGVILFCLSIIGIISHATKRLPLAFSSWQVPVFSTLMIYGAMQLIDDRKTNRCRAFLQVPGRIPYKPHRQVRVIEVPEEDTEDIGEGDGEILFEAEEEMDGTFLDSATE